MGKLEGNVGVLTIEVDAKEVNNSIDAAFKKVVKQLTYQVSVKENASSIIRTTLWY